MASVGAGLMSPLTSVGRSMYSDRVPISHITSNTSLGEEKVLRHLLMKHNCSSYPSWSFHLDIFSFEIIEKMK